MSEWIEWNGGDCPVDRETVVEVRYRNLPDLKDPPREAIHWRWIQWGKDDDIIAYRVVNDKQDSVNHPPHYNGHPSGVECIQITEHMSFCRGNAMKYLWRAGEKGDEIEDLKKARWYIDREIQRLEKLK